MVLTVRNTGDYQPAKSQYGSQRHRPAEHTANDWN